MSNLPRSQVPASQYSTRSRQSSAVSPQGTRLTGTQNLSRVERGMDTDGTDGRRWSSTVILSGAKNPRPGLRIPFAALRAGFRSAQNDNLSVAICGFTQPLLTADG